MDGYKTELVTVKQELADIEGELDHLLRRQSELLDKKEELERLIKQSVSSVCKDDTQWDRTDFKWSKNLTEKQKSVFHITKLRPMQLQTMNVTMSGKDCILIMPTGGGKSLCFQLPALLYDGVTLVVSPLVSLMEDQVMALRGYNVSCNLLNASTDKETLKQVQDAMIDKNASLKLLYVTPEKLAKSKRFMAKLEKMYQVGRFSRLVIDEVHCCSQWGHDFRPDYKFLGIMKRQFPGVPMLGLTATATTHVLDDVKKILNIQDCQLFRASFNRPNLYYEVRNKPSAHKEVMDDIVKMISLRFRHQSGNQGVRNFTCRNKAEAAFDGFVRAITSIYMDGLQNSCSCDMEVPLEGIVYTFSKKEAEDVTIELQSRGVKAGCYHADLNARERSRVHRAWIENSVHVVVATIAFGMGIDKPDVRFVIHHSLSKSMENFYQESGRAGRDDKTSHCILYYRFQDVFRQSAMVMAEQTGLRNLYGIMEYCVDIGKCRRSMIARYFGEVWEKRQCKKMCDHCNSDYSIEKKDITQLCSSVLRLIDNATGANQKLTATKLLDAWQGKGATVLRVKGTDTSTDRDKLERILAFMLMNNYIREDFHFTPYSTISYLVKGDKARLISSGTQKVYLEMPGKRKQGTENGHTNTTATSYGFQSCAKSDKPKLVVINSEKSAFSSFSGTQSQSSNGDNHSDTVISGKEPPNVKKLKKRKKPVVNNDSDSDVLDFGSEDASFKIKKRKSGVPSESLTSYNQKQSEKVSKSRSKCADKGFDSSSKHNSNTHQKLTIGKDDLLDLTSDVEEELNAKGDHSPVLGRRKTIQMIDSDSDFE